MRPEHSQWALTRKKGGPQSCRAACWSPAPGLSRPCRWLLAGQASCGTFDEVRREVHTVVDLSEGGVGRESPSTKARGNDGDGGTLRTAAFGVSFSSFLGAEKSFIKS